MAISTTNVASFTLPPKSEENAKGAAAALFQLGSEEGKGKHATVRAMSLIAWAAARGIYTSQEKDIPAAYKSYCEGVAKTEGASYLPPDDKSLNSQHEKFGVPFRVVNELGPEKGLAAWMAAFNFVMPLQHGRKQNMIIDMGRATIKAKAKLSADDMKEIAKKNGAYPQKTTKLDAGDKLLGKALRDIVRAMNNLREPPENSAKAKKAHKSMTDKQKVELGTLAATLTTWADNVDPKGKK